MFFFVFFQIHPHQISDLLTDCQTELQVAGHSDARGCWEPEAKAHMQSHVTPVPPPNTGNYFSFIDFVILYLHQTSW